MKQFVVTNIFLRYITRGDEVKQAACAALFERAMRGKIELATSEAVITEVVYVLSSPRLYQQSREAVFEAISLILGMQGLRVENRQRCIRAIYLYAHYNVDFADALIAGAMEENELTEVLSYDKHMDRITTIRRVEP